MDSLPEWPEAPALDASEYHWEQHLANTLCAAMARLYAARDYMRHDPRCDVAGVPRCMTDKACNCGFDELIRSFLPPVSQRRREDLQRICGD